jgi:hypothetical protein
MQNLAVLRTDHYHTINKVALRSNQAFRLYIRAGQYERIGAFDTSQTRPPPAVGRTVAPGSAGRSCSTAVTAGRTGTP